MSKTDKTRPGWVKAFFDAPIHHDHRKGVCREETFEDAQAWATRRPRYNWRTDDYPTCTRYWGGRYTFIASLQYGESVPGWFVKHVWREPERRRERDDLRDLAREYNTYGDLEDDDFPNYQARNSAKWYYW